MPPGERPHAAPAESSNELIEIYKNTARRSLASKPAPTVASPLIHMTCPGKSVQGECETGPQPGRS
jgi:hypothetical protein